VNEHNRQLIRKNLDELSHPKNSRFLVQAHLQLGGKLAVIKVSTTDKKKGESELIVQHSHYSFESQL